MRQACARWLAIGLLIGSCAAPSQQTPKKPGTQQLVREDACAARMHDLSQALLLFCLRNGQLPETLEQLKQASDPTLNWECPVTHKPYVYDRVGFYDMEHHTRIVLFDPTPAHLKMRWAIQIVEPEDRKKALVAEVVLKPESIFIMRSER